MERDNQRGSAARVPGQAAGVHVHVCVCVCHADVEGPYLDFAHGLVVNGQCIAQEGLCVLDRVSAGQEGMGWRGHLPSDRQRAGRGG